MKARFTAPKSLEEEMQHLETVNAALPVPLKNLEQAREKIRAKWSTGVRK